MKKLLTTLAALATSCILACSLVGCGRTIDSDDVIIVGASQTPHAEILKVVEDNLKEAGYTLEIQVFDDYVTPNTALEDGSIDANYFQHTPYLNTFNADYNTHLKAVEKIHYEPFGVYGKNVTKEDFTTTKTGRTILVPNDGSNLTRALFVLRDEGYITLKAGVTASDTLTVQDIENSNGNTVSPVQADTVATQLEEQKDGTIAVINGNYALQAGLKVANALAVENAEGDAAQLYANIIAVKEGNENHAKIKALVSALRSKEVFDYITAQYNGAVLPVFSV